MRPLKIKIEVFDDIQSELIGYQDANKKITNALIDLDEVYCAWEEYNGNTVIALKSGESFGTKSINIEKLLKLIN
jgi:hypothetical protein